MTPNQSPLSYAVKMVLKCGTVILCICFATFGPIYALSLNNEAVPLYDYIMEGSERVHSVRTKRGVLTKEDINVMLDVGDVLVQRLANFEDILKAQELSPGQDSPSYPAMLVSRADDTTVPLGKQAYINMRASLRASEKFCRNKPLEWCTNEMRKVSKLDESREECVSSMFRSYNGSCNNVHHPRWGLALTTYERLLPPSYQDGIWEPRGKETYYANHVKAADVSDKVVSYNDNPLSDVTLATVAWANHLSYDMAHTVSMRMMNNGASVYCCDEEVGRRLAPRHIHPFCYAVVDQNDTKCYNYVRSLIIPPDEYILGPAQQVNAVTHYLDGSVVYGSTPEMSTSLRTMSAGLLKDIEAEQTIPSDPSDITGEMRVNTDILGAVVHALLVKEHNRVAKELFNINSHWDDERLFQEARRIVVAELQHITYAEWLPLLIGEKETSRAALKIPKTGHSNVYDSRVKPNVFNSFANAAMRFVISMVDDNLNLHDEEREVTQNVSLTFSFINSSLLVNNFDSLVRGITTQQSQACDLSLSTNVHRHLYTAEGSSNGFDALSLDIQRGRDHGLPPYVSFRKLLGYRYSTFNDLVSTIPRNVVNYLKKVYPKVNTVDLVVGGLAEAPKKGSILGPIFSGIISHQMAATRTGDLYFYDNKKQPYPFTLDQLNAIKNTTLARIFCDNSSVKKMQPHAFHEPDSSGNVLVNCEDEINIPRLNLQLWREETV